MDIKPINKGPMTVFKLVTKDYPIFWRLAYDYTSLYDHKWKETYELGTRKTFGIGNSLYFAFDTIGNARNEIVDIMKGGKSYRYFSYPFSKATLLRAREQPIAILQCEAELVFEAPKGVPLAPVNFGMFWDRFLSNKSGFQTFPVPVGTILIANFVPTREVPHE